MIALAALDYIIFYTAFIAWTHGDETTTFALTTFAMLWVYLDMQEEDMPMARRVGYYLVAWRLCTIWLDSPMPFNFLYCNTPFVVSACVTALTWFALQCAKLQYNMVVVAFMRLLVFGHVTFFLNQVYRLPIKWCL